MAMTVSPRSEQINAVLSPHLPPPLTNIIISYKTMFEDEEAMTTLKHLVTNLSGKEKMQPSEDGYDLAVAMVNKLYQAFKEENLFNSCIANTKMTPIEQIELAKRHSILYLAVNWCKTLQSIPQMDSIVKDRKDAYQFYEQIPERLPWVWTNSPIHVFNENDLAQLEQSPSGPQIRYIVSFNQPPYSI